MLVLSFKLHLTYDILLTNTITSLARMNNFLGTYTCKVAIQLTCPFYFLNFQLFQYNGFSSPIAFWDSKFFVSHFYIWHLILFTHYTPTLIALNLAPIEEKEKGAGSVTDIQRGPYRKKKILQHIRLHYCLSFGSI